MARTNKAPDAVGGRLAAAAGALRADAGTHYHTGGTVVQTGAADDVSSVEDVHTVHDGSNGGARTDAGTAVTPTTGRTRTTVAEPGSRQGLQPGWTRATVIVREDVLDVLKDLAYTNRVPLKEVIDDALSAYVDGIDRSALIHRNR